MATSLSTTTLPITRLNLPKTAFLTRNRPSTWSRARGQVKSLVMLEQSNQPVSLEFKGEEKEHEKVLGETISDRWTEIHGEDDWVGLLDPMDPLLRSELIRYGEMAQACYDAFDYDRYSINCGSCRYAKNNFFKALDMSRHSGYKITRYLFATSNINLPKFFKRPLWSQVWSKSANWIGYVAVSDDETSRHLGRRDIVVAWRGTVTSLEWLHDLMDILKPVSSDKIPCPDPYVKVESGFVSLYADKDESCPYCQLSAREQVLAELSRLMEKHCNEEVGITVTGHSLGAALAVLSAFDVAETGLNIRTDGSVAPVCVFSFSGPRVGNTRFKERLDDELGVKVLRVHNVQDVVPMAPGLLVNEGVFPALSRLAEAFPWSYSHVGVELVLDHRNSPFLKDTSDRVCAHNLEALLHLIEGYHGKGEQFSLASERDIALVNKGCDFLKDEYQIPPNWRQDENKGMVRTKDGRWLQPERPLIEEIHDEVRRHLRLLGLSDGE